MQLNKRGRRGRRKAIIWKRLHGRVKTAANLGNLIQIKANKTTDIKKYNRNFLISTANVQSLKNKSEEIHDYITESGCDIMVLTETWLKVQMKTNAGYSAMNSTEVTLKLKYQIGNLEEEVN